MMCGNENLRTPNLFVRKLIMFLFLVPFILINGDNGVHGHHDEIATATANTFSASNLVHFQLAHEDNEQQSNGRSRRGRRRRRRQQHVMPDNRNVTDAAASFKSEFQPNNVSSSTEEHKYRNSSQDEITIEYRDGYENNKNHTIDKNGERILSRRRRYLIFPPGSSVQIGIFVIWRFSFLSFIVCMSVVGLKITKYLRNEPKFLWHTKEKSESNENWRICAELNDLN